jgi:L-ascorbate metabolism protein UlaG (beta-lactamase superfamily)
MDRHSRITRPNRALACHTGFFRLLPVPTSRVELTLDANLLPSKVASPKKGEMRPIRQQTGQRRSLTSALPRWRRSDESKGAV